MLNNEACVLKIEPIGGEVDRPFWSVMIPTYNCTNYLGETLTSVLIQDPGPEQMQIEVVDDGSTKDDPEAVVREIGQGRVGFFRQPKNVGAPTNFNTCIQRAKGHWVHILHGDDIVLPGFYDRLKEGIDQEAKLGAAFCRDMIMDENSRWHNILSPIERKTPGVLENFLETIYLGNRITTPSIVVKRSVYEEIGGYNRELFHSADWDMWKRVILNYSIWYEPQILACFRRHSQSDTNRLIQTGANVANIRRSIEISESYLPSNIASKISRLARENYAFVTLNTVRHRLYIGDIDAAVTQTWECLQCSDSPEVIASLVKFISKKNTDYFLEKLAQYAKEKQGNQTGKSGLAKLQEILQLINTKLSPIILIDGVFFQLYKTGIARVWKSLLEEWSNSRFAKHIIVLDRAGTAPNIPGIRYRRLPAYDYNNTGADRELLQRVCDAEGADLFISSYYTTPTTTPSVFMAYDMIPEVMGWDMRNPMWQAKHQAIRQASAYITISENTARDLVKSVPDIPVDSVTVAHCGVSSTFNGANPEEIQTFRTKYGITKPYFLLVGAASGYKNGILFFQAFSQLTSSYGFDLICTGGLEPEFRAYTSGSTVHTLQLSDEELAIAYSGAVALVYPSKYEGFGMPIVEAMACGCPVITCPNASMPEAAGDAAIYVKDDDVNQMANALCEVQKPDIRQSLIAAGLEQAQKFSWTKMAQTVSSTLIQTTLLPLNLREINFIIFPNWLQSEESISLALEQVIKVLASHPHSQRITLLIHINNIPLEDVQLLLSSVTMNLFMEEDLDLSEGLLISPVEKLGDIQWEALLPRIRGRIILELEDLAQIPVGNLLPYSLENLNDQTFTLELEGGESGRY